MKTGFFPGMSLEEALAENARLRALVVQQQCLIEGLQRQVRRLMLQMATLTGVAPETSASGEETPPEPSATDDSKQPAPPPPPLPPSRRRRRRSRGQRGKPRRRGFSKRLKRVKDHHPVEACPRCQSKELTHLPVEVGAERLHFIPARVCVRRTTRDKVRCRSCKAISTAPMPPTAVPHGSMTADFLAHLAYSKCGLHLPLDRITQDLERFGVELAKSTVCDAFGHVADLCEPIRDRLRDLAFESGLLHLDGTGIKVLEANGPGSHGGQIAVYCTNELSIYQFTSNKEGEHFEKFLRVGTDRTYRGWLVADCGSNMNVLFTDGSIVHCGCWQHAREKFKEALASSPLLAQEGLAWIGTLFDVEHASDKAGEDAAGRLARRQRDSVPRLEAFRRWMAKSKSKVLPDEALAKAIRYCERQWEVLTRFLMDGRIPLTNNLAERELGVVGRGRKNWLFAGSDVGGDRLAIVYTVVRSCQRMGIDPYAYLSWALPQLSDLPVNRRAGQLGRVLPMAFKQATEQAQPG